MTKPQVEHRKISLEQFQAEYKAQADKREDIVVICPACGTLQNGQDLIKAGAGECMDDLQGRFGFSCVGRWTGKGSATADVIAAGQGCNWTLGGMFQIHTLTVVDPDGNEHAFFELASKEAADAYRAKQAEAFE
ncbi:VVA0879 family protein [Pseudomonas fulva]|uniref:VVA0879 family protein n=1 Tax=Pseudomonas fulva TaxID=47880 RepID=UPI001F2A2722|nr:VVA0879 family protein [Pseudomonas fulva]